MSHQNKLVDYWKDNRYKNKEYECYRYRKRFFDRLISQFRKRNKTVVIGKYKNIKGMKYGQRLPPIKYFINYCKRNHVKIVEFEEFNTSKLCFKCSHVLRNYYPKTKDRAAYAEKYENAKKSKFCKLKYCEQHNCKHVINRDINASINIGRNLNYKLIHRKLPKVFDRSKYNTN